MTGLPNRTLVLDRIDPAIAHARCVDEGFAVLFLDLDRFKPINDTRGLWTVASGVEHEGQKTLLRQYGCDEAQGWLFGAALQPPGRNPVQ